jgi:amino acid adenylation domain-containing protein
MNEENQAPEAIAVIGMAGRFPGAQNPDEFWQNLIAGKDGITRFPSRTETDGSKYVGARSLFENPDQFDAGFFGIYPKEAELMDPQHRVFLECSWEALEDAGYDPATYPGMIGVYAGLSLNTYLLHNLQTGDNLAKNYQVGEYQTMLGNDKDFMPVRVSYKLNLRGPSMTVQSACSTSLVAICQAATALLTYQCDMALTGGVSISFPQQRDYLFQEEGMVSPDGTCRAFDADAAGTVFGHGCGVILLKRLSEAIADRDPILGVIKGWAVNNDGSDKIGFAAPGVNAQAEVITLAQASAGVSPSQISYIEAHGTGTPLGDPIEVAALTKAFREGGAEANEFCMLGTGKTHIGHLDCAAGVAGLIKTIQQFRHEKIPALLHFKAANPRIDFANSPFSPVSEDRDWKRSSSPRLAGVSAFGVGGTNAHVVVEEPPLPYPTKSGRKLHLLVLSANSIGALDAMAVRLANHLEAENADLADVCYTLATGRRAFAHRRTVIAADSVEAIAKLREPGKSSVAATKPTRTAFLFPGQGSQYVDMSREIYDSEQVFRAALDECAMLLRPLLHHDIRSTLYPSENEREAALDDIHRTALTQPCIFAVEYALAKLWISWGVKPALLIGHSIGEYVAAVLAGSFKLEHALHLLATRARLMQDLPSGDMLAIRLGADQLTLPAGIDLAAENSPKLCTVSGSHEAISSYQKELEAEEIGCKLLKTSHAFHSAMMEPIVAAFREEAEMTPSSEPDIPWISTCTGAAIDASTLADPGYWARQLRHTVKFAGALSTAFAGPDLLMLEVGPGQALSHFTRQHPDRGEAPVVATLPSSSTDLIDLITAVGELWKRGWTPDWAAFFEGQDRARLHLPTYPFERKSYWIDRSAEAPAPIPLAATPVVPSVATNSPPAVVPAAVASVPVERLPDLVAKLRALVLDLSGIVVTDDATSFTELGFDSLFLTQASQAIQSRFGVKVTFRQMLGELSSVESLAKHLDKEMPASAPAAAPLATSPAIPPPVATEGTPLEQLMASNLQLMQALLAGQSNPPAATSASGLSPVTWPANHVRNFNSNTRFGPYKPIDKGEQGGLTDLQQKSLADLIARYTAKTPSSKAYTAEHRPHYADPRAVSGFKSLWKEMVYPIVASRSKDAKVWDIDGNEYVDITMGFGTYFFGHSPDWLVEAIEKQLRTGTEIGPQSVIAGKLAKAICELTGMERATFCNTGSEAVMAAMRLARTITGRSRIAYFTGDYHGMFEEVLVRGAWVDGVYKAQPIAPGIPQSLVENMLVLDYADPASLEILRVHAHELAAVMVEPVQSRAPGLQPREFMHEVRAITGKSGTALIFDEVVTGFRCAPGGAQAYFGVEADMATYGKVIGGGMPIGVLAGKKEYMDALDGGAWNYGDDSFPEVGVTFFAGTFVRHPLALAAAWRVVEHLQGEGPRLQIEMEERVGRLCRTLNEYFEEIGIPIRLPHFSAYAVIEHAPDLKYISLLWFLLREKGIHVWEGRPLYFTTAHTDEDLDKVVHAFTEAVGDMQAGGFLPPSPEGAGPAPVDFPRFDSAPTTEAQLEMFHAVQMGEAANCAFNESNVIQLEGELDVPALKTALNDLVVRHPALRSTFSEDGTTQFFHPSERSIDLTEHDFSTIALNSPSALLPLSLIKSAESSIPFDLANGPLFRLHLIRFSAVRHELLFTAHHLVCDGWSFGMILAELAAAYNARKAGRLPKLPPAMSFAEFARMDRANSADTSAEDFWVKKYANGAPVLELPTDRPRPPVKTYGGAMESITVDPALYARLKKASPRLGGTLFATLLSSFAGLLHHLTGQEDIVIGVPAAGQTRVGRDELIGHCLNFLPLRLNPAENRPFGAFAAEVKEEVLEAYDHQNYTFGSLLRKIKIPRDPSRVPLVSVIFNIDKSGIDQIHLDGLKMESATNPKQFVNFDLFFNLVQTDERLIVECEYNTDIFEAGSAVRMLEYFANLLGDIAEHPEKTIGQLEILTDQAKVEIVRDWSGSRSEYPRNSSIGELFVETAKSFPKRVAIQSDGIPITYQELLAEATQLASRLVDDGVRVGDFIAINARSSPEMIVGYLAVLLVGGVCVPIDPTYPSGRLALLLEECGAQIGLATPGIGISYPLDWSGKIVSIQAIGKTTKEVELPKRSIAAEEASYLLFTSGSTGRPKGVLLPHRAVVRLVRNQNFAGFSKDDVFLQAAPVSFDASLLEIWGALLNGGKLVLLPNGPNLTDIASAVKSQGVTTLWLTSGLFQLMIDEHPESLKGLRYLIAGGDVLSPAHVRRALELLPGTQLVNGYGPTENTTFTTCHPIVLADLDKPSIPIGKPVSNSTVYLLDRQLRPVPAGIPGELYTGGDGLALGYHAAPELTAEKFIEHPEFGRLYRTGDFCRWAMDGSIEFIGRGDQQVKVRGFRIELGEIEAVLASHPQVRGAKVAIRGDSAETRKICAWVTAHPGPELKLGELTHFIAARLPRFMLPDALGIIDTFPLNANGKITVADLPTPGQDPATEKARASSPPVGKTEKHLAAIWTDLLGVAAVHRDDDFFALGGHSLMALRMFSRINREFALSLPLATLLQFPTLKGLANVISPTSEGEDAPGSPGKGNMVTLAKGGGETPLFCIHGGDGGVLFYRSLAQLMPPELPIYAIESLELGNSGEIKVSSIEETAEDYLQILLGRQPEGPFRLAGYSFGGVVAHEMACKLTERGHEVEFLGMFDTLNPASPVRNYRLSERFSVFWQQNQELPFGSRVKLVRQRFHEGTATKRRIKAETKAAQTSTAAEAYSDLRRIQVREENWRAMESYKPRRFNGRITLFKASIISDKEERAADYGWACHAEKGVDIIPVSGEHLTIFASENAHTLSQALTKSLQLPARST